MRTANYSDFRKNLKHYMDSVVNDSDPVIIPRPGGEGVALISLKEYSAILETEYIMSSPGTMAAIRESEREFAEGKGMVFHNVEEIDKYIRSLE